MQFSSGFQARVRAFEVQPAVLPNGCSLAKLYDLCRAAADRFVVDQPASVMDDPASYRDLCNIMP